MRSKVGGILAILGGLLIVASGFAIHGFTQTVLDWLMGAAPKYLPPNMTPFLVVALQILIALITLGGITVIFGGVVILLGRLFTGRLLIALGGGTGLLGFLIAFGYSILTTGTLDIIVHLEYWVGIAIAIVGRHLAKR
jgi:hypothetical protein